MSDHPFRVCGGTGSGNDVSLCRRPGIEQLPWMAPDDGELHERMRRISAYLMTHDAPLTASEVYTLGMAVRVWSDSVAAMGSGGGLGGCGFWSWLARKGYGHE